MWHGDTVKVVYTTAGKSSKMTITGQVEYFSDDYSEVTISQGTRVTEVFLADIVSLETLTYEVKKTSYPASNIGRPSH